MEECDAPQNDSTLWTVTSSESCSETIHRTANQDSIAVSQSTCVASNERNVMEGDKPTQVNRKSLPQVGSSTSTLDATVELNNSVCGGGGITSERFTRANKSSRANQEIEFSPEDQLLHNTADSTPGIHWTKEAVQESCEVPSKKQAGDEDTKQPRKHVAKRLELTSMLLGSPNQKQRRFQKEQQDPQKQELPHTPKRHEGYKHYERFLALTPESPLSDLSSPSPRATGAILSKRGHATRRICLEEEERGEKYGSEGCSIQGKEESIEMHSKRSSGANIEEGTEGEESDQNYGSLSATRVYRSVSGEASMLNVSDMDPRRCPSLENQRVPFPSPSSQSNSSSVIAPPSYVFGSPDSADRHRVTCAKAGEEEDPVMTSNPCALPSEYISTTNNRARTASAPSATSTSKSSLQQRMMRSWGAPLSSNNSSGVDGRNGISTLLPVLTEERLRTQLEATARKRETTPGAAQAKTGHVEVTNASYSEVARAETNGNEEREPTSSKASISCLLSPLSLSSLRSPPERVLQSNTRAPQTVLGLPRIYSDNAHSTVVAEALAAIGEGLRAGTGSDALQQQSMSSFSCSSIHPSTTSPSELGALESPMALNSFMLMSSPMANASSSITSLAPLRKELGDVVGESSSTAAAPRPATRGKKQQPPHLQPDESYGRTAQPTHPLAEGAMESPSLYRTPPRTRGDADNELATGNSPGANVTGNRSPTSVLSWNTNRRSHSPPSTPQKFDHRRPASRQLTPRVPLHPALPTSKLALSSSSLSQLTPTSLAQKRHHMRELSQQQIDSALQSVSCSSHANSVTLSPTAAVRSRELSPASSFLQRFQTPPQSQFYQVEETTSTTFRVSPQKSSQEVSRSHSTSGKTDESLSRTTPEKKGRTSLPSEQQKVAARSNMHTSQRNHSRSDISLFDTSSSHDPKLNQLNRSTSSNAGGSMRAVEKVSRRLSLSIAAAGIPGQKGENAGSMDGAALPSFQHYQEPPKLSLLPTYTSRSNASSARRVCGGRDMSIGSARSSVLDTSHATTTAAPYRHGPSPLLPPYTFLEGRSDQAAQHPLTGETSSMFLARPTSYSHHHSRQEDEVDFLLPNRNPFSLYRGWAGLLSVSRVNITAKSRRPQAGSDCNTDKENNSTAATSIAADILAAPTQPSFDAFTFPSTPRIEVGRGAVEFSLQPHAAAVVFQQTYPTTESDFVDAIEVAQLSVRANMSPVNENAQKEQRREKRNQSSHGAASPVDEECFINDVSDISRRTTPASPIPEDGSVIHPRRTTAVFPKSPDNTDGVIESLEGVTSPSAFRKAAVKKTFKPVSQQNVDAPMNVTMPSIAGKGHASDPTCSDTACVDHAEDADAIADQHTLDEHNRTWPQLSSRQRLSPARPTLLMPSLKAIPNSSAGNSMFTYSSPKRQLVSISLMDSQEDKDHDGRYNNVIEATTATATGTTGTAATTEGDSWCERARHAVSLTRPASGVTRKSAVSEPGKDSSDPPTGWATATPSPTSINLNADLQRSTPFVFRSPGAETKSYASDHCMSPFSPDPVADRLRSPIEMQNILFAVPQRLQAQGNEETNSAGVPLQFAVLPYGSGDTPDGVRAGRDAAIDSGDAQQADFASGSLTSAYAMPNSSPGRGMRGAGNLVSQSSVMSSFSRPRSADLADIFSDRDISPTNRPSTTVWVDSDRLLFCNAATPVGQHSTEFPQSSSSRKFFGSSLRSQVTAPGSPQTDYDPVGNADEHAAPRNQPPRKISSSPNELASTPKRPRSTAEDAARIIQKAMLHLSPKRSFASSDSLWTHSSPNSKFLGSKTGVETMGGGACTGDGSPIERMHGGGTGRAEGGTATQEQPADRDSVFTPIKYQNSSKQKMSTAVQDTPKKVETPPPAYRGVELQRIRSTNHPWDATFDTMSASSTATSATAGRRGMRLTSALAQLRTGGEADGSSSVRPGSNPVLGMASSATHTQSQPKEKSPENAMASSATGAHAVCPPARGGSLLDGIAEAEGTQQMSGALKADKSEELRSHSVSSPLERPHAEERSKEEIQHLSSPPLMKWGVPPRMNNSLLRTDQSVINQLTGLHDDANASSSRFGDATHSEHDTFLAEHLDTAGFTGDRRQFMDDTVDYDDEDDENINPLNRFRHHHRYQFLHRLPWRVLSQQQPNRSNPHRKGSDSQIDERQRSTCTSSKEENGTTSPGGGPSRSGSGTSDQRSSIGMERKKHARRGSSDADGASHATEGGSSMQSLLDSPSLQHIQIDVDTIGARQGSEMCRNLHLGNSEGKRAIKPTGNAEAPSVGFIPLTVDRNGIVWLATSRADGMPYAVKEVDLTEALQKNASHTATSLLQDELACYLIATSPDASPYARNNLARYYTVTRHEMSDIYMIQSEYFAQGSVVEWILRRGDPRVRLPSTTSQASLSSSSGLNAKDVTPQQWLLIVQHGLLALRELHQCNLVHGNPLPFNLFVASPHQFKLGNFGSAVQFPSTYPNVTPSVFLPCTGEAHASTCAAHVTFPSESGGDDSVNAGRTPYQSDLHVFAAGMLYLLHRYLSFRSASVKGRKSLVDMHCTSSSFSSTATGSANSASMCCSERCFYDKQHVLRSSSTSPPSATTPTQQSPPFLLSQSYAAVFDILHLGTQNGTTITTLLQRIDAVNNEAFQRATTSFPQTTRLQGENVQPEQAEPKMDTTSTKQTGKDALKSETLPAYTLASFSLKSHAEEELRLSVDLEISTLMQQNALMRQRLESMKRAAQAKQQQKQRQQERKLRDDDESGQRIEEGHDASISAQTKEIQFSSHLSNALSETSPSKFNGAVDTAPVKRGEYEELAGGDHIQRGELCEQETLPSGDDTQRSSSDSPGSLRANTRGTADRVRPEGTPPLVPASYRVGGTPLTGKLWHPLYGTPYSPSDTVRESINQLQVFDSPVGSQRSSSIHFSPLPTGMLPCSTATLHSKVSSPYSTHTAQAMASAAGSATCPSQVPHTPEKALERSTECAPDERSDVLDWGTPDHRVSSSSDHQQQHEKQQQQLQRTPKFSFIPVAHSSPIISPARRSSSLAAQSSLPATPKLTHAQRFIARNSAVQPPLTSCGSTKGDSTPLNSSAMHTGFSTPLRSTGPRVSSLRNSPATPRLSLFSEVRPKIDHHQTINAGRERSFSTPHGVATDALGSERRSSSAEVHAEEDQGQSDSKTQVQSSSVSGQKTAHIPHDAGIGAAPNRSPRDVNRCLIADDYSDDNCSSSGRGQEKPMGEPSMDARRKRHSGSDKYVTRVNSVLMGSLDTGRANVELGRHSSCPVAFSGGRAIEDLYSKERKTHRPVLSLGSELAWNSDFHSAAAGMQSYAIPTPKSVDALFAHNTSYFHNSMLSGVRSESIFTQTADRSMSRQYLKALSHKRREEKVWRNRLMEVLADRNLSDPDDAILWIIREINRIMQLDDLHPSSHSKADSPQASTSLNTTTPEDQTSLSEGVNAEIEETNRSSSILCKNDDGKIDNNLSLVKEEKRPCFLVAVTPSTYPLTSKEL